MSEQLLIAILNFAVKFSIDAALIVARGFRDGATIDQAIASLELAKTKTAQQYLDEAAAKPVVDMPVDPSKDVFTPKP